MHNKNLSKDSIKPFNKFLVEFYEHDNSAETDEDLIKENKKVIQSYEEGYEQGFQVGLAKAYQDVKDRYESDLLSCLQSIEKKLSEILHNQEKLEGIFSANLVLVTKALIKKFIPSLLKENIDQQIVNFIENVCEKILTQEPLKIIINPSFTDDISNKLVNFQKNFPSTIDIIGDEKISNFECQIIWEKGRAILNYDDLLSDIEEKLGNFNNL